MLGFNKKSNVSIELTDYILRALIKKGGQPSQWAVYEIPLPQGIVEDSTITDEMALFQLLKNNLTPLGGKRQKARLLVPDVSVLLKTFACPDNLERDKLKEYVQMELGRSIHLPFHDPLLDVYDAQQGDGKATLFAAPAEEVEKLAGLLQDVHVTPETADIRALCNLRLLADLKLLDPGQTYMVTNWSINELSICVYCCGQIEFLRYESIKTDLKKWQPAADRPGEVLFSYLGEAEEYRMSIADQILELDRILNFYTYSLHKGNKSIDKIIVMGDNPLLDKVSELLAESLSIPIQTVDNRIIQEKYPNQGVRHASLIGLALKEVRS